MNASPIFDEVIGLLLEVKRGIQRMKHSSCGELIEKLDTCITRIAPLNDVWNSRANSSPPKRTYQEPSLNQTERNSMIEKYRPRESNSEIDAPNKMDAKERQ